MSELSKTAESLRCPCGKCTERFETIGVMAEFVQRITWRNPRGPMKGDDNERLVRYEQTVLNYLRDEDTSARERHAKYIRDELVILDKNKKIFFVRLRDDLKKKGLEVYSREYDYAGDIAEAHYNLYHESILHNLTRVDGGFTTCTGAGGTNPQINHCGDLLAKKILNSPNVHIKTIVFADDDVIDCADTDVSAVHYSGDEVRVDIIPLN